MLAPSPGSPSFPAHHAERSTTSGGSVVCRSQTELWEQTLLGCLGDKPRPLAPRSGLGNATLPNPLRSRAGLFRMAPRPSSDRFLPLPRPASLVDRRRSGSRLKFVRLWPAGKCVSAATAVFCSVLRTLGAADGEVFSGRGYSPSVGKGFWASSDIDSLSPSWFPWNAKNLCEGFHRKGATPATRLGPVMTRVACQWGDGLNWQFR